MDTVQIDGVTLTRAQVEEALKTLNTLPKLKGGDIVVSRDNDTREWGTKQHLVISPTSTQYKLLEKEYCLVEPNYVRLTDGCDTWTKASRYCKLVGKL